MTKGSVEWWRTLLVRLGGTMAEGASAEELSEMDTRLRRPVCASYRSLLQATNGFPSFGAGLGRLLPTTEVDWFPNRNPGAVAEAAVGGDLKWRPDIPLHSLEITDPLNGTRLLLRPKRGRGGGEWEAWLLRDSRHKWYQTLPDFLEHELLTRGKS